MTIPMPESVAWLHEEGDHIITAAEKRAANATFARYEQGLITTTQAEAYADARVREALMEAYRSMQELHMSLMNDSTPYVHPAQIASFAANRISALIKSKETT